MILGLLQQGSSNLLIEKLYKSNKKPPSFNFKKNLMMEMHLQKTTQYVRAKLVVNTDNKNSFYSHIKNWKK
jgi:hypothetical protein